jgi:hypothetical protein
MQRNKIDHRGNKTFSETLTQFIAIHSTTLKLDQMKNLFVCKTNTALKDIMPQEFFPFSL